MVGRAAAAACLALLFGARCALALHADIEHGIIHDFFEGDGSLNSAVVDVRTATAAAANSAEPQTDAAAAARAVREAEKDLATNLVSDILRLQDVPPNL